MSNETTNTAVPKLRFPEFEGAGEWEEKELGDICEVLNNRRKPITGSNRTKGQYPYYGASGIVDYVKDFIFDERLLLVGEDGAKWGAFENTAFIVAGEYWVNNHAHVLRPVGINDTLLEKYLVMLDLAPFVTGAAPPKLTLGKLKGVPVPVPPTRAEQQKIAATLSTLDDLLTAHSTKLAALQAHKRGLMQGLFPAEGETVPKLRFPEFREAAEWEEMTLGEMIQLQRGFDLPHRVRQNGTIPIISSSGNSGYHNQALVEAPGVVTGRYGTIGEVFYVEEDFWPLNTTLYVKDFKGNIPAFIAHFLKTIDFASYSEKSGVPGVNRNDLHQITAACPTTAEQQKIVDCLSSLDNRITAQAQRIEALKLHKKGLMQGLFPAAAE